MITKVALTAWKRLFPYLSDASQHAIAKDVRKPLAEYNASVAKGATNRANKMGIEILGRDGPKNELADSIAAQGGGGMFTPSGKYLAETAYASSTTPEAQAFLKDYSKKTTGSTKLFDDAMRDMKNFVEQHKDRADSVPTLFIRRSRGTAKDDFFRNTAVNHELSEGKHVLQNYKISPDGLTKTPINGVDIVRPANSSSPSGNRMNHFSLGVLRDELKDALKSGYMDLYKRPKIGVLSYRTGAEGMTNELPYLMSAGRNSGILGGKNYTGTLRNGEIKKMQKRFFTNLDNVQKAHNVKRTGDIPINDIQTYELQNLPANRTWLSWKRHKRNRIIPKAKEWMTHQRQASSERLPRRAWAKPIDI